MALPVAELGNFPPPVPSYSLVSDNRESSISSSMFHGLEKAGAGVELENTRETEQQMGIKAS